MQLALDLLAPPLKQARAVGGIAMSLAEARAERDEPSFKARAQALILEKLARGPASGEDCTDFVRAAGLQMADGRALGASYSSLARKGLIKEVGQCARRKGHGGAGGRVLALTTPGPVTRNNEGRFSPAKA